MSCNDKKIGCQNKEYAKCVYYEVEVPDWSLLVEEECVNIEETTADIYGEITNLKDRLDFSEITSDCFEIETEDGVVTPKSLMTTLVEKVEDLSCEKECDVKCDIDITDYGLDFKCLVDPCGEPITKLSTLLQILINEHCS